MRQINVGWWESLAHAIFGVTGSNPIPDLAEHVQVVADLTRLRPEHSFPAGVIPFTFGPVTVINVAAQFQASMLVNKLDSGVLFIVDEVQHNTGLDAAIFAGRLDASSNDLGEVGSGVGVQPRDTRYNRGGFSDTAVGVFGRSRSHAVLLTGRSFVIGSRNTSLVWARLGGRLWWVVHPGAFIALGTLLVNQGVTDVVWSGYVIPLHKGVRA